MNKAILMSTQPYYVFLIIARRMGWDIPQNKTIEVRKDFPKDSEWNRRVHIYCSKNRKSFNRIPKQYQPFMAKLLGKVIGEFVCDRIEEYVYDLFDGADIDDDDLLETCLDRKEINIYAKGKTLCGIHITDLEIYDTPKELGEFNGFKKCIACKVSGYEVSACIHDENCMLPVPLTRAPQSFCYVEEI